MTLDPEDLKVEPWPSAPQAGMLTGQVPKGIRATHLPTGQSMLCESERDQAGNRAIALRLLEERVEWVLKREAKS